MVLEIFIIALYIILSMIGIEEGPIYFNILTKSSGLEHYVIIMSLCAITVVRFKALPATTSFCSIPEERDIQSVLILWHL